jgi:hypothetical protein
MKLITIIRRVVGGGQLKVGMHYIVHPYRDLGNDLPEMGAIATRWVVREYPDRRRMKKTMGTLKDRARAALKPLSGSLRMRVVLGLLLGVMVALWLTTLALMYFLKQEMLATLAAQQYSVVSLLANDIDRSVTERIRALEGCRHP